MILFVNSLFLPHSLRVSLIHIHTHTCACACMHTHAQTKMQHEVTFTCTLTLICPELCTLVFLCGIVVHTSFKMDTSATPAPLHTHTQNKEHNTLLVNRQ